MKKVVVLGSTGSIGRQTLEVVKELKYEVVGLGCNKNVDLLKTQLKEFGCEVGAAIVSGDGLFGGLDAYTDLVKSLDFDILVAAASGLSSLKAVLYALEKGKRVALANKEIAVCAGGLLVEAAKKGELIPVDSEHSAIFQCLQAGKEIKSVTITCSGGALRDMPIEKLPYATVEDALRHPNWSMGDKITVDCATMANKAFEVVEAATLFDIPYEKIKVTIHKESLTHGFVTFVDGSIISQVSRPDMRTPIRYALTYPNRSNIDDDFDLIGKTMTFSDYDEKRYPLFKKIVEGSKRSAASSAFIAGLDEGAVGRFLKGDINYLNLHRIITAGVENAPKGNITTADEARAYYDEGVNFAKGYKV
ncbi:MAG: 1-deoxy-D-xylulose-5-phosphate reductoisomerase [Clostridia bacterium]|nr:1-deoxy-D-xylulose-5-phosphate reductoisomerase [Clostridia bacterium]